MTDSTTLDSGPTGAAPSVSFGRALVKAMVRNGIEDVVLCPGSRSAPIALALAAADARGLLRLHVAVDERGAGFLAVGLARGSGRPAAVLTTSGTAVANLHPAVLEAHHDHIPLIVLSADRPEALRALGANQVIDQAVVFTGALRAFADAERLAAQPDSDVQEAEVELLVGWTLQAATGVDPGPVQLNLPLADPLLNPSAPQFVLDPNQPASLVERSRNSAVSSVERSRNQSAPAAELVEFELPSPPDDAVRAPTSGERVLFVAAFGHPAAAAIAAAGHPVISEAGGAAGSRVLSSGIPLLEAGFADSVEIDRVVLLGRPTLFRCVQRLLSSAPVVDVVSRWPDPTGRARTFARSLDPITAPAEATFRAAWQDADSAATAVIGELLDHGDVAQSPVLARTLLRLLPTGDLPVPLVVGSSQSPRDIGRFAAARDGVVLHANRGVAGIDGTVSLAKGVALGTGRPAVALLGDLTFLHDATGLAIGPHEPRPDLTIVVANNDGGAIFSTLESGEPAYASSFERIFGTPVGADLASLCTAFGVEHTLVTDADQLRDELQESQPGCGLRVLEVPTSRSDLRDLLQRINSAVRAALGA